MAGVRTVDERTVVLEPELPAGRADCARDPRVEYLRDAEPDRPDTIYASGRRTARGTACATNDHCDLVWIDKAVHSMDIPEGRINAARDVVACDAPRLVMELNRGTGDCPPEQACASTTETRRLFLHFGQHGSDSVASTRDAGCAAVHTARPDFPAALCESLPALG